MMWEELSKSCRLFYNKDNGKIVKLCYPSEIKFKENVEEILRKAKEDHDETAIKVLDLARRIVSTKLSCINPSMSLGHFLDIYVEIPSIDVIVCDIYYGELSCIERMVGGVYAFTVKTAPTQYLYDRLTGKIVPRNQIIKDDYDFYSRRYIPIIDNKSIEKWKKILIEMDKAFTKIEEILDEAYPFIKNIEKSPEKKKELNNLLDNLRKKALKEYWDKNEDEVEWIKKRIITAFAYNIPLTKKDKDKFKIYKS